MGVKYLWDTNIAIYYLQRQFPRDAEKFMDEVVKVSHPCISAITEIEFVVLEKFYGKRHRRFE